MNQQNQPPQLSDNRINPMWQEDGTLPICNGLCSLKDGTMGCKARPDDARVSMAEVTVCRPAVADMAAELVARQGN